MMLRGNSRWLLAATLALALDGPARAQGTPWALPNFSDRIEVVVSNPTAAPLDTLAVLDVAEVRKQAPGFPGTLAIVAEQSAQTRFAPSQVDEGSASESGGALVFPVKLAAHASETFEIYYSSTLQETLPWPRRVHATHSYGFNSATAAIESELIGYRMYGGFFLDVQAHEKGELGLFNSLIGFTSISQPPVNGRDIIHLGDTLGLGGIFLRAGTNVYRPPMNTPDYAPNPAQPGEPTYRVLTTGPLRALIAADLPHWKIGSDEVALHAIYEMRAGEEAVLCHLWVTPLHITRAYEVGMGVRDLPDVHHVEESGVISLDGVQKDTAGRIGIGVGYDPGTQHRAGVLTTGEGSNEIVVFDELLKFGSGVSATYHAAAAWQGSGWSSPVQHVAAVLAQSKAEPKVIVMEHDTTPHPERLKAEPK
jgi:hypothetical protein